MVFFPGNASKYRGDELLDHGGVLVLTNLFVNLCPCFHARPDDDEEDCINRRKESRDMSCPWTHDSPESVQEGDDEPMSYVHLG